MMYNKRNFGALPYAFGGIMEDIFHNGVNRLNDELSFGHAPVNIQETENGYDVHVVAPGLKKEDMKISVDKNLLQISYEHKDENKDQQTGKWIRNEYKMRSFKRSFTMNEKIDAGKISAKYTDGVLVISLPKKEVAEPAVHEIAVN